MSKQTIKKSYKPQKPYIQHCGHNPKCFTTVLEAQAAATEAGWFNYETKYTDCGGVKIIRKVMDDGQA